MSEGTAKVQLSGLTAQAGHDAHSTVQSNSDHLQGWSSHPSLGLVLHDSSCELFIHRTVEKPTLERTSADHLVQLSTAIQDLH